MFATASEQQNAPSYGLSAFKLLVEIANRVTQPDENQTRELSTLIKNNYDPELVSYLKSKVNAYVKGENDLSGLEFYKLLEFGTYQVLFHTIERKRERNRLNNGLQQTYGDHIKIFLFGLDKLKERNLDWFRSRIVKDEQIEDAEIMRFFDSFELEKKDRRLEIALWIATAFHDYGKLLGKKYGLDAEDSESLAGPIIEALLESQFQEFTKYLIRNHDSIEYIFNGESPVQVLLNELKQIDSELQSEAVKMLGIIQLVGASSLGEGRITERKFTIYNNCSKDYLEANKDPKIRLYRLLYGETFEVPENYEGKLSASLDAFNTDTQASILNFLDKVLIRNWEKLKEEWLEDDNQRAVSFLASLAGLWQSTFNEQVDYFIFSKPIDRAKNQESFENYFSTYKKVTTENGKRTITF